MMTRTDRRRFPILFAAIVALTMAGAALGLLLSTVRAQEAGTLLSNTGQETEAHTNTDLFYPAQGFITGSKAGGYVLTSIELDVATAPGTPSGATVELWSSVTMTDIDGNEIPSEGNLEGPVPDARIARLTHSTGTWTTGLNTFNAPSDTHLLPKTTYFVYVSYSAPDPSLEITNTESSSADSGDASGWDLPEGGSILLEDGVWLAGPNSYLKFKVNGYELRNRPSEIRAYWTDSETNGSNEQVDCASTERFRAYWNPPKSNGSFKRADEWEAQITPKYGASNVSFTIQDTGGDRREPELTGTVRIRDGEFGSLSIRVRGRFDSAWGAWSPVTSLLCLPPPPPPPTCPEDANDVWCGVITVEEKEGFYGFNRFQGTGELSDDDFDVGTNSYTIDILEVQGDSEEEDYGDLTFKLAERPDDAQQEALDELTLYLDNDPLSLSDSDPGAPGFYYWDSADLDWSREDYIVARLRESSSEQKDDSSGQKDDSSGQKKQSEEPGSVPDKPNGLKATATHGQVVLTWDDPENDSITSYVILRRHREDDPKGEFRELVGDTKSAATTYADGSVAAETPYTYRIKAINEHGTSERSRWVHIDTPAAPEPDNDPATGAPTISGTAQVGETLTADTKGIADENGTENATFSYQWLANDADIADATGSTYTLTDSEEGKPIRVQVSFTDDAGNEESLTSAATDAVAAAEPSEPPAKPRGLSATASNGQVVLSWDDPGDDSITGYVILRRVRVNDQGGEFSVLVADTGTAATTYTDNTVAASTTYTYRIKAINEHGTSERSRWYHIDTPAPPVPDQPKGLSATASHESITLTWDDPGDDTITGYVILRRNRDTDAEGHFDELVADTGTAATTYTDNTVAAETRYTYRIKAINEHGASERSRWYHISTPAAP